MPDVDAEEAIEPGLELRESEKVILLPRPLPLPNGRNGEKSSSLPRVEAPLTTEPVGDNDLCKIIPIIKFQISVNL